MVLPPWCSTLSCTQRETLLYFAVDRRRDNLGILPESQGQSQALSVLYVPSKPDSRRSQLKKNCFTEICSGSEEGSYLRFIDFCITQLSAGE